MPPPKSPPLVVVAAGVFAGLGSFRLASGIIAILSLLLVEKSRLHSMVARIDDVSLRAAVRFGVMALVILPLLPSGPYGPLGGIRPRELWALVLFFSGLSFLGYVARRAVGPAHGYFVTGLIGGLISSTNVTFTFARLSRVRRCDRSRAGVRRDSRQRGVVSASPPGHGGAERTTGSFARAVLRWSGDYRRGCRRIRRTTNVRRRSRHRGTTQSPPVVRRASHGRALSNRPDGGASGQSDVGRVGHSDFRRCPGIDRRRRPDDVDGSRHV